MSTPETTEFAPPYIPFRTLLSAVERMEREGGIPSQIDRSYLSNLPWSSQNHFIAASKTLGLIDGDGRPTDLLIRLVENPSERKALVAEIVRKHYAGPVSLGTNATQQQLEDQFKGFGLSGSTLRKAVAFYLHAAKFAEIPLSQHFRSPRTTERTSSGTRRKKTQTGEPGQAEGQETGGQGGELTKSDLHPFLQGLLRELPEDGATWDQAKRARWLQMAELTVDMLYKVDDEK